MTKQQTIMNNKAFPITPPPELVQQWSSTIYRQTEDDDQRDLYIATQAARWGSDQELEACCEWLKPNYSGIEHLRAARRPKPPSLKQQALRLIDSNSSYLDDDAMSIIRRALESLPD